MKTLIILCVLALVYPAYAQNVAPDTATVNFIRDAANGGMMEVNAGKIAATKGRSVSVRQFGQRMVKDHSELNSRVLKLAGEKSIQLSNAPAPDLMLTQNNGAAFDRAYVTMMVEDHEKDVAAFEHAAVNLKDPETKAFVNYALPILKDHLARIKAIAAEMRLSVSRRAHPM
jgi:putative membrane protein